MLGATIGTYRITGAIGRGGMGAVYLAEHTLLGRSAAVKVLLPELSQNQDIVTRFFNEAKAATAIRHPGIVEIYDFGWDRDGSAYIVMEYLQGESLALRMSRGRVGTSGALSIVRQIAGALAAAHAKGIVHRDLKPDNIHLVADPEVPGGERIKLLDFGIAKLAVESGGGQKTRTGSVIGTPTYMAPEQCRGVSVDRRADLYSLGCLLFEMLTGRPPFIGEGLGDVLAAHIHVAPPALTSLVADLPPAVDQLVQRLLAKDPAQRVQTAEEVIHAIDAASGGPTYRTGPRFASGPTIAMPSTPTTLSGAVSMHGGLRAAPPRRRFGLWIGLGGALVAAGIVAAIASGRDEAPRPAAAVEPAEPTPPAPVPTPAPEPVIAPPAPVEVAPAKPASIAVSIETTPPGAQVLLRGQPLGATPFVSAIAASDQRQTLTLRLAGYKDAVVAVDPGTPVTAAVKLEKKHAPPPRAPDRDRGVNPFGP